MSFLALTNCTKKALAYALFPKTCLCCQQIDSTSLCKECVHCLPHKKTLRCPACQESITPLGSVCVSCFGTTPLAGIFSASPYKHPTIKRILSAFKYGFDQTLAHPIGHFLAESLLLEDIPLPDTIIPVPLHPRRLRWRGFNQSALLAHILAKTLLPGSPLPVSEILLRSRHTTPQAKTDTRKSRQKNLRGAFVINPDYTNSLDNTRIWIIDDVSTTATTLTECARTLKKAGAKEIWGITVAG